LLLALIGTYGVLAFMVAERRREIGIRVSLGATRGSIVGLVTTQGLAIASIGLTVGLACAVGLSRLLASLLFGVEPTDAGTLAAVALTIAVASALACAIPAWRAARLDPNVVLRG
jgi:ABC-type antimicrobial peptide transport system permease subunit